jgi:Icc-related predicted phosphoesterase
MNHIRVAHASDLHGNILPLKNVDVTKIDAWILSGDFFPNITRGNVQTEINFQTDWFRKKRDTIFKALGDKPVINVDGNHDFVSLGELLRVYGYAGEVHQISEHEILEFHGLKFAGHGYIPWIEGEWRGELRTPEMTKIVDQVWDNGFADVLVTHTAPAGILAHIWGCNVLANRLTYRDHSFTHHFFGHIHQHTPQKHTENGTKFYNSATGCQIVEIY